MPDSTHASSNPRAPGSRWTQLLFGVGCMVAASNIQYSWTLFVPEIQQTHGWQRAAIQTAFTIFVIVQTWSTPLIGHFIDRHGPRVLVLFGGVMTGLAWVVNSYADSLAGFYLGSVVGGLGVGAVYATSINNALKWFPDKRGLAVGLTAAGYGSGTVVTIVPIAGPHSTRTLTITMVTASRVTSRSRTPVPLRRSTTTSAAQSTT